jgi:hypothetical protein
LAETEISSEVHPKKTPTLPKVEEILESEKLVKDVEELFVPDASKFFAALRRIALCIISSSVTPAPSSVIAYRPLNGFLSDVFLPLD